MSRQYFLLRQFRSSSKSLHQVHHQQCPQPSHRNGFDTNLLPRMFQSSGMGTQGTTNMGFQNDLTDSDKETVLNRLNCMLVDEMRFVKGISSSVAMEICRHREEKGPFKTLQDVLEVRKVGTKSLQAICQGLRGDQQTDALTKSELDFVVAAKLTTPTLSKELLQNVRKVTSLEFSHDSIYYTTMTRDLQVEEWSHIPLKCSNVQRQNISHIVGEAYRTVKLVPRSDMYLMETRANRHLTPGHLKLLLFIYRLQTAVQTLLNSNLATGGQHSVYQVKDSLTVKTFDLRFGSERVSGQPIISQIEERRFDPDVSVPGHMFRQYHKLGSDIAQEKYSNCFLLALGFCLQIRGIGLPTGEEKLTQEHRKSKENV